MKIIFSLLISFFYLSNLNAYDERNILYQANRGNIEYALQQYQDDYQTSKVDDIDLIHQIAFILLDFGFKSPDHESNLLTLFGAAVSQDENAQYILEDGLQRDDILFQLIALNYLAKAQNESTNSAFVIAMRSPFLPIRLEALFNMAEQKHPKATSHIASLMQKLPIEMHSIFPKLFALSGDSEAIRNLQRMLCDQNEVIRLEAINAVAIFGRDDLLPDIRRNASHINIAEKEASLLALGLLDDHSSLSLLQRERKSKHQNIQLAALRALKLLGVEDVQEDVRALALKGDVFAITFLGEIPGNEEFLKNLVKSRDLQIKFNACLALLELKSPYCLPGIMEILFNNKRDLSITRSASRGNSLPGWKVITSFSQKIEDNPVAYEVHLNTLENILVKAQDLPGDDFIKLAHIIFENEQKNLIPILIHLLEKMQTKGAIDLLKYHSQKIGSPFVRNWCNLALYRLKEEGNYLELLKSWVLNHKYHPLIKFRPLIPWDKRGFEDYNVYKHRLTPQETSRLLIEVLEALVESKDSESIKIILQTIKEGKKQNRYTIAGLLLRL